MANTSALINRTGMFIDATSNVNPVIQVTVRDNQITEVNSHVTIRSDTRTIEGSTGDVDGGSF